MNKRLKKWTLEIFWTHFEVLQSSEFMISAFHDYSLEPKITKCGDLLYAHDCNLYSLKVTYLVTLHLC